MQVSILMVRALAGMVEHIGQSRDRFLSEARIDPRWLEDGSMRLPFVDYGRAIDAALSVSGDPAFGLRMGEHARSAMFDVIGPLTEQAETLRMGFESMQRYTRLMADGHQPELHEAGDTAAIRFSMLRGDFAAVRMTAEFSMAALWSMLALFVGEGSRPNEVCFAYPKPPYFAEYERLFGSTARFDCACTEMVFPRSWLDRTQRYSNPELYALLKTQADRALGRLDRDVSLSDRIERILASSGTNALTMDDVARELSTSARSLRRRMSVEGVSFSVLLTRNRTNVARRMLERPNASIQETAHAMGFASPAAFHRAFKRWTGMTPKQYQSSF